MKRGKLFEKKIILIFFIMLLVPFAFALETKITIQSEPNADVTVSFLDLNTGRVISPSSVFYEKGDESGKAYVTYNSEDKLLRMSMTVQVGGVFREFNGGVNNTKTKLVKFSNVEAGKEIYINLNIEDPVIKIENSEVVEETETQEVVETNTSEEVVEEPIVEEIETQEVVKEIPEDSKNILTGMAIAGQDIKPILKKVAYFGGIFVIGLFFIIGFLFFKKKKSKNNVVKVRDKPRLMTSQEEAELMDAERRIKEAEIEIKEIRNKKSELEEAEKRLEQDKQKLKMLKGE